MKARNLAPLLIGLVIYWVTIDSELPLDWIRQNAQKRFGSSSEFPLAGKTAIVTGASGGLGLQTALQLHGLGCNVILAARSLAKCDAARAGFNASSPATSECRVIDTGDLESVSAFVGGLSGRRIDMLVNNAGMHYISHWETTENPLKNLSLSTTSPQGLDAVFVTNYLGHWLLTQLLLPSFNAGARVVNVASTYHWQVDGQALAPEPRGAPLAAQSLANYRHRKLAYANSKLAQILHVKELQQRLKASKTDVSIVGVCPGWVATDILPKGPIGKAIHKLAFTPEAATLPILHALTTPSSLDGVDYLCSAFFSPAPAFAVDALMRQLTSLGLRGAFGDVQGLLHVVVQRLLYGRDMKCRSSPESYNVTLRRDLFDWSASFVHSYAKLPAATSP